MITNKDYDIHIIRTQRFCYINAISKSSNIRIGKVCIDLESEDSTRYKLSNKPIAKIILVSTNQSACGNGVATALLNKAIEVFNNYTLYLNVVPLPRDNENPKYTSKNGLMNFYSKFGFKKYNKDICITTMIR